MIVQMEPIKINLNKPVKNFRVFNIVDMIETDDELVIKLKDNEHYGIHVGEKLKFSRNIYYSGTSRYTLSEQVTVLYKDEDNAIHTTRLKKNKIPLYNGFDNISYAIFDKDLGCEEIGENIRFSVIAKEDHNIFPQDLLVCPQEFYFKDKSDNILLTVSGNSIYVPLENSNNKPTSADCITLISDELTCGRKYKKFKTYQYDFASKNIHKRCFNITLEGYNYIDFVKCIEGMDYIETKYNLFYYHNISLDENGLPNELDADDKPVRHCVFYEDVWAKQYEILSLYENNKKYIVNKGQTNLSIRAPYWESFITLSTNVDESKLGCDDNFNTSFITDVEESLIPDVIDMERLKYSPMVVLNKGGLKYYKFVSKTDNEYSEIYVNTWIDKNNKEDYESVNEVFNKDLVKIKGYDFYYDYYGNNGEGCISRDVYDKNNVLLKTHNYIPTYEIVTNSLSDASSIILNFHFRKRKLLDTDNGETNSVFTENNIYTDGWFVDPETTDTTWWNGMDYNEPTIDHEKMEEFITESGTTSDLLGYLNFTDNDVFYRKKKVSQSFVRLSFYTSTDPIEQKLLYYSTSFLDATTLYGKYLTQMLYMNENVSSRTIKNESVAVVTCSANTNTSSVDSRIVLTNEFDTTKSSEGFNIFLFGKDRNVRAENGEKTIYMKVEFNHAGNGKTIPMIMWPKVDDKYVSLTTQNFIQSLYIPIKLAYINGKYTYYIPNAEQDENGNINLILFEPKIDVIETEGLNE